MDKSLKIGFLVFAVFAVIFGIIQIGQTIKITNSNAQRKEQYTNALEDVKTRVLDTDEDGLTDWEEANLFGTSAYLADSDSDGIDDKDEIDQGTDPNCEQGKTCGSGIIDIVEDAQQEIDNQGLVDNSAQDSGSGFSEESEAAMKAIEQGLTPTVSQIRALLKDSGIPGVQVNIASDEELMGIFNEVASQNQ